MAPNAIQQFPIIHQRLTRHNNPFEILVDDDDDEDTNTIVASNCSPQAPCPTQRPQTIQPTSHPPSTEPTTIRRPPPLRSQTILLPSQPPRLLPPVIMPRSRVRPRSPPTPSPHTLLFLPPVAFSVTPHDLRPHRYNTVPTQTPTATPGYNFIEPNDDHHDRPTTRSSTPPRRSIRLINTHLPGNIAIQAMHHIVTLEAFKVATQSQWTGPIINIKEHCFDVVHPITKQAIMQYKKLQHDLHLKDLWVPAFSKEVHCLTQGKPGVTKATNTIFFLSHNEVRHIPKNRTVTYARIVIDHRPHK
jgi:hypothetical protein